jgi:hypothetical protein
MVIKLRAKQKFFVIVIFSVYVYRDFPQNTWQFKFQ